MTVLFREVPIGSTLVIDGAATITVVQKTGKKVRLRIESKATLTIQNLSNQAQECRNKGDAI